MRFLYHFIIASALYSSQAMAAPLIYTPVNPSFGGSPLNYNNLMTSANAQNKHKDKSNGYTPPSSTENFAQRITDSVLLRVSTEIADQIYGENAKESGTYILGNSVIKFKTVGQNIVLTVDDGAGGLTTVQIPKPAI